MSVLHRAAVAALVSFATLGPTSAQQTGDAPDFDRALRLSQSVIGRPVGEFTLQDRLRREVKLSDYRGKPLVVSFVYTSCSQACPVTTQFLAKSVKAARQALGPDSFNVVTIGFNQPFDSPDAMVAFARQNRITESNWEFLSPDLKTVTALTSNFGFTYYATPKGFDHIAQVTVVDGNGLIYRQVYGESFDLPMLVGPLKELLSGQATRAGGLDSLWTKVKLFCTVYDPGSGGYRVNYSLFVEIFIGASVLIGIAWYYIRERRRATKQRDA
jgi:protein SCO1